MKNNKIQGGGNAYVAPTFEVVAISSEKGFAASTVDGSFGTPGGGVPEDNTSWF
ncbi:MAG: hypothetical protein RR996_06115 [Alistipes sp.]